jgi:hypothetical protein
MTDRTTELAFELADETARSDIECMCGIENEGGYRWYNMGAVTDPEDVAVITRAERRAPDFIIGSPSEPYLLRWWLIARNKVANAYLHCFKRSDDDRAHHGHPWLFNFTLVLRGSYTQHRILAGGVVERRIMKAGDWTFRWGASPHRIELHDGDCWTLFLTGPVVREWGFHCPDRGWIHWKKFTAPGQPGQVGKGCEQ